MFRLIAVRTAIATLKRAISLSARLKPTTWELLAVCCAALFVLSAWGLQGSKWQDIRPSASAIVPQVAHYDWSSKTIPDSRSVALSVAGMGFVNGCEVIIVPSGDLLWHGHVAAVMRMDTFHMHLSILLNPRVSQMALAQMGADLADNPRIGTSGKTDLLQPVGSRRFSWALSDVPSLVSFFGQSPVVIVQSAPAKDTSPGKRLMFWAPLLGLLLTPLTGFGMLSLAWLGHHRKRGEEILLQLQIAKIRLENDNLALVNEKLKLELALARQEVNKPRITLA